jgi:co-chaperonin GroES (HSP10)
MKLTPQPGWVLCKNIPPVQEQGKLIVPVNQDQTVSEGVAEIEAVSPLHRVVQKTIHSPETFPQNELKKGDRILYRGFLRFANQVGELFGGSPRDYFFLQMGDVLAVVEGEGNIGFYGEYRLGEK